jgi:hypothetical protein
MNVRPYLRGALWGAGILAIVFLVAGALWVTLLAMGDQGGSQGAKGVALVAFLCLVLDLIAMVVLLALAEISRPNESAAKPPDHENSAR